MAHRIGQHVCAEFTEKPNVSVWWMCASLLAVSFCAYLVSVGVFCIHCLMNKLCLFYYHDKIFVKTS